MGKSQVQFNIFSSQVLLLAIFLSDALLGFWGLMTVFYFHHPADMSPTRPNTELCLLWIAPSTRMKFLNSQNSLQSTEDAIARNSRLSWQILLQIRRIQKCTTLWNVMSVPQRWQFVTKRKCIISSMSWPVTARTNWALGLEVSEERTVLVVHGNQSDLFLNENERERPTG